MNILFLILVATPQYDSSYLTELDERHLSQSEIVIAGPGVEVDVRGVPMYFSTLPRGTSGVVYPEQQSSAFHDQQMNNAGVKKTGPATTCDWYDADEEMWASMQERCEENGRGENGELLQFIDWTDPTSYFNMRKGYVTETPLDLQWRESLDQIAEVFLRNTAGDLRITTDVLVMTGNKRFLINSLQRPFLHWQELMCPSCFEYHDVASLGGLIGTLVNRRLQYMELDGQIADADLYDTLLIYHPPYTWDEMKGPVYLGAYMEHKRAENGEGFAPQRYALNHRMLTYRRLVGPGLTEEELLPDFLKADYVDPEEQLNPWVRAARCWMEREHGHTDLERFLRTNGFIPGSRTPLDMQYGPLRHVFGVKSFDRIRDEQYPFYWDYGWAIDENGTRVIVPFDDHAELTEHYWEEDQSMVNDAVDEFLQCRGPE